MANYYNQEACHIMLLLCWAHNQKALQLIFTWMQDNSDLDDPLNETHLSKENVFVQI